jgi:ankyrin repeat protein
VFKQLPEIVRLLVDNGANCNTRNKRDNSPLDAALKLKEETTKEHEKKRYDKIIEVFQLPSL